MYHSHYDVFFESFSTSQPRPRSINMKAIIAAAVLAVMSASVMADVHVRGYYRDNGTYVQPHVRTAPDSNPCNNYSSRC
jgi:hypothetical protein